MTIDTSGVPYVHKDSSLHPLYPIGLSHSFFNGDGVECRTISGNIQHTHTDYLRKSRVKTLIDVEVLCTLCFQIHNQVILCDSTNEKYISRRLIQEFSNNFCCYGHTPEVVITKRRPANGGH